MDEKWLEELNALLDDAKKSLDEGDVETAKEKIAAAQAKSKKPDLPIGGGNVGPVRPNK